MSVILWAIILGFILTNVSLAVLGYHLTKVIGTLCREIRHLQEQQLRAAYPMENSRAQAAP